jgi:3-oxoacyl-[acyl-carrier protein] reductase
MAFRHSPWHGSYSAVKAALNSVTQSLGLQLAPQGIRVNTVAPGAVEFPGSVWEDVIRRDRRFYEELRDAIPFGRLGSPAEIADVVMFLASPAARWVTGQVLLADGGQSLAE